MTKKTLHPTRYDSGPNMTPLVDVVMVILIFLMLAGSFGGASRFLSSKQAITVKGPGLPITANTLPDIDVQVDQLPAGDGFSAVVPGNKPTDSRTQIRDSLQAIRQKYISEGASAEQLQVVIHPSKMMKQKFLIQVYDSVLRAKFENVSFAMSH